MTYPIFFELVKLVATNGWFKGLEFFKKPVIMVSRDMSDEVSWSRECAVAASRTQLSDDTTR